MSHRPSPGVSFRTRFFQATFSCAIAFAAMFAASCGNNGGSGGNGGGGGGNGPAAFSAMINVFQGKYSNGEQNAGYQIIVSNTGSVATSGQVTVVDPPTGFTVTAIAGSGWACTLSTTTCTRSDALAGGAEYPPITVNGNVTAANGSSVSISLMISGGGVSTAYSASPTISVAAPILTISETSPNFNLGQQNAAYTVNVGDSSAGGATNSGVTVTENALPSGETLVSMSGSGWTCGTGSNTCTAGVINSGANFQPLTIVVNVAANATSPQTNSVTASGGGATSSVNATDSTTINSPDIAIAKSHSGTFTAGNNGTFNLAVSNVASGSTAGPSAGTITVTDTLSSQFTFVSATISGWSCSNSAQTVTCTTSSAISPGSSAPTIPLVVGVSSSATGTLTNTASVSAFADSN
jgi:uncharacterized repeat protein (TIGR01451 family)